MFKRKHWVVPLILPKHSEKLSPLTLGTEGDTPLPLSQLYRHFIFAKVAPTLLAEHPWCLVPISCHSFIPWVEPERPTGSLRVWWDMAVQELPERDPHLLWLKGEIKIIKINLFSAAPVCCISAHWCRARLPPTMPQVQTKFSEILSWITQRHSYSLGVISTQARLTLIKYLRHWGIEEFGLVLFKFAYVLEVLTYSDLTFSEIFPSYRSTGL